MPEVAPPRVIRVKAQPITGGAPTGKRKKTPAAAAKPTILTAPRPAEQDVLIMALTGPNAGKLVELWKTDKPITPSAGYGGHPLAARPKRAALTVFEGRQPFALEAQLYLYNNGESVQQERTLLEALAISPFKGYKSRPEPPRCSITGQPNLLPAMPGVGKSWWIEDLKWEDEYRYEDWTLYWNVVTVTLLEALNDEVLEEEEVASGKTSSIRGYYVKPGDTLHSIAAKMLGSAKKWQEIGKLNKIRSDGQLAKKVGEEIKIPG